MLYSLSVVESKSSGGRKGIKASSCYSLKSPSLPGAIAGLMTGCHVSVQCCHMEHQPTSREVAITMSAQSTPHTDCALKDRSVQKKKIPERLLKPKRTWRPFPTDVFRLGCSLCASGGTEPERWFMMRAFSLLQSADSVCSGFFG